MPVTLIFHLEPVESGESMWWTESPDLPGFYATREHLEEVRVVSEAAAAEALREQGVGTRGLEFRYVFARDLDGSSGVEAQIEADDSLLRVA